ncbi:MAG TPA: superoxide dismutase family protein [Frankiaceae bacterium]|nr:superoxide dismutase family protein [Frankiaceae bacterium]
MSVRITRRTAAVAGAALAAVVPLTLVAAAPAGADGARRLTAAGPVTRYATPDASGTDTNPLPATGAVARVRSVETPSGRTIVTVVVDGFTPDRHFGAHVHTKTCGATGAAAGPHYQDQVDPVTPSVDPAYANPENEIWLDLHTDSTGHGEASASVPWVFQKDAAHTFGANSVIFHRDHTAAGHHGTAGTAGPRLACFTVPFTG